MRVPWRLAVGIAHETIRTDELARPGYRANGEDRCYHCKSELYDALSALAQERGYAAVLSGANADDVGDWRPGLVAASEHDVIHPLLEAGVTKAQVRELARELGVPSAEKVASPCLASRVPHGTPVDPEVLRQVDAAEQAVRALGYAVLRVRHHGDLGKLELAADELDRALQPEQRRAIAERDPLGRLRADGDRPRALPLGQPHRGVPRPRAARDRGQIAASAAAAARGSAAVVIARTTAGRGRRPRRPRPVPGIDAADREPRERDARRRDGRARARRPGGRAWSASRGPGRRRGSRRPRPSRSAVAVRRQPDQELVAARAGARRPG